MRIAAVIMLLGCYCALGYTGRGHAPHALRPDGGTLDGGYRRPTYKDAYAPHAYADRIYFEDLFPDPPPRWAPPGVIFPAPTEAYGIIFWPKLDAGYEETPIYLPRESRCVIADAGYLCRRPVK